VLLRSVLGLHAFHSGDVRWYGKPFLSGSLQTQIPDHPIGIMFQDGALFSALTVLENITVPLHEHTGISVAFARELALLKIHLVGLPASAAAKFPDALSGGMRKRAGIARALALDPEILCLDEPTSGLDPVGAAEFDQLVLELKRGLNLTVLMVTHDLDSVFTTCDRVAVLADKRVVVTDTPGNVTHFDNPWVQACFNGPRARALPQFSAAIHKLNAATP
jgi:phospholipid/cholesterol/gamma-HCH transport system ATP-binding protein